MREIRITLELPEGWDVSAILRLPRAVGYEPPYQWEVRAVNEQGDEAGGIEDTISEAAQSCSTAINEGLYKRKVIILRPSKEKFGAKALDDLLEGLL